MFMCANVREDGGGKGRGKRGGGEREGGEEKGERRRGEGEGRRGTYPAYLTEICLCVHVLMCTRVQLCCHDYRINCSHTIQSILRLFRNHGQSMAHRFVMRHEDEVGIILSSAL